MNFDGSQQRRKDGSLKRRGGEKNTFVDQAQYSGGRITQVILNQDQDKTKTSKCKRRSNPFSCRVPPLVPPLPPKMLFDLVDVVLTCRAFMVTSYCLGIS